MRCLGGKQESELESSGRVPEGSDFPKRVGEASELAYFGRFLWEQPTGPWLCVSRPGAGVTR